MSEYIRKRKIDTNECPNIYSLPIYSNIRIFEYIRHTLIWMTNIKSNDDDNDNHIFGCSIDFAQIALSLQSSGAPFAAF